MKFTLALLIAFFITNMVLGQLWLIDPLEAIYPDKNKLNDYSNSWETDTSVNGIAHGYI